MKRKNVLFLYLCFLPHLAFWTISYFGRVRVACYAGFFLSTLLLILAVWKSDTQPIFYFNILFFSVASIASLFIGKDLEERLPNLMTGEFAALLIMAGYCLLEKRPFYLEVASRDYPESMRFNPVFRKTYRSISHLWSLYFLSGLILSIITIFLLKGETARRFPPVMAGGLLFLNVVATILTAWRMPRIIGKRTLEKNPLSGNWVFSIHPHQDLRKNQFEVAVIGGGLGGLSCAALLSKSGLKVFLAEQSNQVGGYCSSLQRDGYALNLGPTIFTGISEGGALDTLLRKLGIREKVRFIRSSLGVIAGGNALLIPDDADACMEKLCSKFPATREDIERFFSDIKAFRGELRDVDEPGLPSLIENLNQMMEQVYTHPLSSNWHYLSEKDLLDEYFKEPALRSILAALIYSFNCEVGGLSAYHAAYLIKELLIDGCGFPQGGLQNFSRLLADTVVGNGGILVTNNKVETIILQDSPMGQRVVGLKMEDGSQVRAQAVVMAADPHQLIDHLLPPGSFPTRYSKRIGNYTLSPSAMVIFLGVRGELDMPERVFLLPENPPRIRTGSTFLEIGQMTISHLSGRDCSQAPPGVNLLNIKVLIPQRCFDSFEGEATRQDLEQAIVQAVKKELRLIIPDLEKRLVFTGKVTPFQFLKKTLNSRGAILGFQPSPSQHLFNRPDVRTPFPQIYLASCWSRFGLGAEGAILNGMLAARDILNGAKIAPSVLSREKAERRESTAAEPIEFIREKA